MRCPLTYEEMLEEEIGQGMLYSQAGLRRFSPRLEKLRRLPYTVDEQHHEAMVRAAKISIQGVQAKLSVRLNVSKSTFELVNQGGQYILKPPSLTWPDLPANEDLTMRMAKILGLEVPLHGLIYSIDNQLCYLIKRFDRQSRAKLAIEDFAQLMGATRQTKYRSSVEVIIKLINQYTTFPSIEHLKLFERLLFCFLTGNEDMHLKNFSIICRSQKKEAIRVELSPVYDLLNTTIAIKNPIEESALPLNGKKSRFTKDDFLVYLARDRLNLTPKIIDATLQKMRASIDPWLRLIDISFLSDPMKEKYRETLLERVFRMGF